MIRTLTRCLLAAAAVAAVLAPAQAQYRYGSSSYGSTGGGESGLIVILEGGLYNPRNVDHVVATEIRESTAGTTVQPIRPDWDEDVGGRIALGWAFATGNQILVSYSVMENDLEDAGSTRLGGGSFLAFPIGPPVSAGGGFAGHVGAPGFYDVTTEIRGETADVLFARDQALGEAFSMHWSAGVRYALFEETHRGIYDVEAVPLGDESFDVAKSNEGEMVGLRLGARGSYRVGMFRLSAGVALSFLDGELTAASSVLPSGADNGTLEASSTRIVDDGRSGSIREVDAELAWVSSSESLSVGLGWQQETWEEIAADLVRNFPQTVAPLRDRDSVTFSGWTLGLRMRF